MEVIPLEKGTNTKIRNLQVGKNPRVKIKTGSRVFSYGGDMYF